MEDAYTLMQNFHLRGQHGDRAGSSIPAIHKTRTHTPTPHTRTDTKQKHLWKIPYGSEAVIPYEKIPYVLVDSIFISFLSFMGVMRIQVHQSSSLYQ